MDRGNISALLSDERSKREELQLSVASHIATSQVKFEWLSVVRTQSDELQQRMRMLEDRCARIEAYLQRLDARIVAASTSTSASGSASGSGSVSGTGTGAGAAFSTDVPQHGATRPSRH
jgi:phage shock protein A